MKEKGNISFKIIAFICAIMQIFISIGISSFAVSDDKESSLSNVDIEIPSNEPSNNASATFNNSPNISIPELTYTVTKPNDYTLNTLRITLDNIGIVDSSFEAEGLMVNQIQGSPEIFDIIATDEFGKLDITAEMTGGETLNKTIYTYYNGSSIYTSDISSDNAWHICKQFEFENSIITLDDWFQQYSALTVLMAVDETEYSFDNIVEMEEAIASGNIVISGRLTWETEHGNILPLSDTKVELREWCSVFSRSLITTETNEDGYYWFIIDPEDYTFLPETKIDVFIRTYIESSTLVVSQPYFESFNFFDSQIINDVGQETGIINISRRITKNSNFLPYRLVYIQQGMVLGQRFALDMGMVTDKQLYVFYIGNTPITEIDDTAFCYDRISLIGHSNYNDFFTTIHEYGHYVENRMGNYGSAVTGQLYQFIPDDFNGLYQYILDFVDGLIQVMDDYTHYPKNNNFRKSTSKHFQMELTWSEAWATAFAKIAYQYYISEYEGVQFNTVLDYESGSASSFDGEAQEYAVASFLWDIYDSAPEGATDDDDMSMTAEEWWAITTKAETYTLQDLTNNILENYPELIEDVGEILSNHNISPGSLTMVGSPCVDGQLKLVWDANGGSSFPNDKFKIAFYDNDNNKIGEVTTKIESVPTVSSPYCVPTDVWEDVMENYEFGKTIYAVVYGYRSGEFDSGPYFSTYLKILDKETEHNYTNKSYNSTHHWNVCACGVSSDEKSEHSATYSYYTPTQHYRQCSGCGYQTHEDHEYDIVSSVTDEGHIFACVCGVSMSFEEHYAHSYERYNKLKHYVYCECGHYMGTNHHVVRAGTEMIKFCIHCGERLNMGSDIVPTPGTNSTGGITYITEAGSYVDSDGIIYLVESDMRLYLDGQLDVYALVESLQGNVSK